MHGCVWTSILKIRYSGCMRSLGVVASVASTTFQMAVFVFFSYTSANLQLARKSKPSYFCRIPIICLSVRHGRRRVCFQPLDILGQWYWTPCSTSGPSRTQSQGHVEQRGIRQLDVLFLWSDFTDLSAEELLGRVGFYSLWFLAVFRTHKLRSI